MSILHTILSALFGKRKSRLFIVKNRKLSKPFSENPDISAIRNVLAAFKLEASKKDLFAFGVAVVAEDVCEPDFLLPLLLVAAAHKLDASAKLDAPLFTLRRSPISCLGYRVTQIHPEAHIILQRQLAEIAVGTGYYVPRRPDAPQSEYKMPEGSNESFISNYYPIYADVLNIPRSERGQVDFSAPLEIAGCSGLYDAKIEALGAKSPHAEYIREMLVARGTRHPGWKDGKAVP